MAVESGTSAPLEMAPKSTEVASVRSPFARNRAAGLVAEGKPIGSYNRGVCAIWVDGANPNSSTEIARIKGEQRGARPLAASLPTEQLVQYLDLSQIPPSLHATFQDAQSLAARTGSLCFFRAPITEQAAKEIPPAMVSYADGVPIIQNWDPRGHRPTNKLVRAMHNRGVDFPGVTSMNVSGQPELIDQDQGVLFSREHGIPMFLTDDKDPRAAVGSYTILNVSPDGLELAREGNIPSELLAEMLGHEIKTTDATTYAKSMQPLQFPVEDVRGVHPGVARIALLSSLNARPHVVTKGLVHVGRALHQDKK